MDTIIIKDLGKVSGFDTTITYFFLVNSSSKSEKILKATSGCSCTYYRYSKDLITKGDTANITNNYFPNEIVYF